MSRKIPPDTRTYSRGGGPGSRLVIRTRCSSPILPDATASWTERCAASNRRLSPSWRNEPAASTAASARSTSTSESETGFSSKSGLPVAAAATTRSTCVSVLEQIAIASTSRRSISSELDAVTGAPSSCATDSAVPGSGSYTAASASPGTSRTRSAACIRPIRPTPRTPTRRGRRRSPAHALPALPVVEAAACGEDLVPMSHLRDTDLPERAARRPVVRRRPDDDDGRPLGGPRPPERRLELVDRRDLLREAAERARVRDPVDGRATRPRRRRACCCTPRRPGRPGAGG